MGLISPYCSCIFLDGDFVSIYSIVQHTRNLNKYMSTIKLCMEDNSTICRSTHKQILKWTVNFCSELDIEYEHHIQYASKLYQLRGVMLSLVFQCKLHSCVNA